MAIKAIVFDMDGVIIDTEPFWKTAEHQVFSSVGVTLTNELCEITKRLTTKQVAQFWFERNPWKGKSLKEVENEVVDEVNLYIAKYGSPIDGIQDFLKTTKKLGYKVGLATNSPFKLIPTVLRKLNIEAYFDAIASSEHELEGKPNPAIYKTIARKLNVAPSECIVIEDSQNGIIAAQKAGMKTIAICSKAKQFEMADARIFNYSQLQLDEIGTI